jgi:hypothetical protein
MNIHLKITKFHGKSVALGAALVTLSIAATGQAQDRRIINEPGGIGVDQTTQQMAASSAGALILFQDDRSGESRMRVRAMDAYGTLAGPSAPVEDMLEPVHGFRYGSRLAMSENGSAILSWSSEDDPYWGLHNLAWIDSLTGQPISEGQAVGRHEAAFVSEQQSVLVLSSEGATLQASVLDDTLTVIGGPLSVVDESEMDFSNGINRYDVAFNDDGTFLMSWVGTNPPYFDVVKSRLFDSTGKPIGPVNVHSIDDELFWADPKVARTDDGYAVMWSEDESTYGQRIDSEGILMGSPTLMWQFEGQMLPPGDIQRYSSERLVLLATNGMILVESDSLTPVYSEIWTDDSSVNDVNWFPAISSAVEVKKVVGVDGDQDIVGWRHDIDDGTSELGLVADDVNGAYQTYPSTSGNAEGKVVAWLDNRSGANGRIGFKIFDEHGDAVGPDQFLEIPGRKVYTPQVSMNAIGEFAICWIDVDADDTGDYKSMKYQRYDAAGQPSGTPRVIHVESGFLEPIFGAVQSTPYNKREFLLLENGDIFAVWGLRVVTGGTIGNPIYGRTDILTRSFTSSDHAYAASENQLTGGKVHALVESGDSAATVYYGSTVFDKINMVEFFATGQTRVSSSMGNIPDIGGDFHPSYHFKLAIDDNGTSITWYEDSSLHGDRCFMAHYDPAGELVSSEILPGDNTSSWIGLNPDGTRTILHGNGQTMYSTLMGTSGERLSDPRLVFEGNDYEIGYYGFPAFEILTSGGRLELTRHVASGTDQATDIELTTYQLDLDTCADADYDCDGLVNGEDLARLLAYWGLPDTDLDGDGTTNGSDLTKLLGQWSH